MPQPPPHARQDPVAITQLGRTRVDEYAWLRDDDWRAVMRDPGALRADIRAHLEAENAYAEALMADAEALKVRLVAEMRGRMKEDDAGAPENDGPWAYSYRYEAGAQHPRYVRTPRGGGPETLLLDVEALAQGKAYCQVAAVAHAPDHQRLAYAIDDQGSEVYRVVVRDLATGRDLPDPIGDVAYGQFCWAPDGRTLFYVWRDEDGRPARIYRRAAEGGPAALVYSEPDPGLFLSVSLTESRAFVVISSANQETSEHRVIPADDLTAEPRLFAPRAPGQLYEPTHVGNEWLIRTNADGAVDFKVMRCGIDRTDRAAWIEALPHRPGVCVEALHAFAGHVVRLERADALPRLIVQDRATGAEHVIAQDEEAYALTLAPGHEFETATMRFVYQSPAAPRAWFDYDMARRARTLVKTQEVPSGHDPAAYQVRRIEAVAPDGARVPVTLLMRAGTPQDGTAPVMLYGYGAYGNSTEASFSGNRLSLVDRGWIWAIAHVRGGAERGRAWFEAGRKSHKTNSFTDFVAVAETLIAAGWTQPRRIAIYGGSAGGLLVGAAANLRPELWGAVIAAVPFVDALNTMSDPSLPLTPPEWPEWGDPTTDPAAFDAIAAYAPYEQVADRPYPPILATGGLSDPRVTYWEPAKWIARLRARAPHGGPYLLKTNMDAGHGGASGRFEALEELAFEFAFALKALGAAEAGAALNAR